MAKAFNSHSSWSALENENSDFVKFLNDFCVANGKIETRKLKVLGVLWCEGKPSEKAEELYDLLQDNNQETIAASDKDTPIVFKLLMDIAT